MERECLDCGSSIRGRADKKFCDDQCRSSYNNRLKAQTSSALRPVNAILRKNHSILARLCTGEEVKLKKDELLLNGFNPQYHTHHSEVCGGNQFFFCYNYGYTSLNSEVYLIIRQKVLA